MTFHVWEFNEACKGCGCSENGNAAYPVSYLDVETRLCEQCYEEAFPDEPIAEHSAEVVIV